MLLATWFGSGLSPKAPGTMGTIASMVLWAPLVMLDTPWWARVVAFVVVFVVGVAASNAVVASRGEDPQLIVIDEVAGMGITLILASSSWLSLVVGFALFRLFDIWKPWPVRWADRQVKGGLGVMLDDVLAGVYAFGFLVLFERVLFVTLADVLPR
jgi:phosphatidylglycerophosphatase A